MHFISYYDIHFLQVFWFALQNTDNCSKVYDEVNLRIQNDSDNPLTVYYQNLWVVDASRTQLPNEHVSLLTMHGFNFDGYTVFELCVCSGSLAAQTNLAESSESSEFIFATLEHKVSLPTVSTVGSTVGSDRRSEFTRDTPFCSGRWENPELQPPFLIRFKICEGLTNYVSFASVCSLKRSYS
jgi:hypothetical protein